MCWNCQIKSFALVNSMHWDLHTYISIYHELTESFYLNLIMMAWSRRNVLLLYRCSLFLNAYREPQFSTVIVRATRNLPCKKSHLKISRSLRLVTPCCEDVVSTFLLSKLISWIGLSWNLALQFCQTETAVHHQIVHPWRTESIWPHIALCSVEPMCYICGLTDSIGQFILTNMISASSHNSTSIETKVVFI